MSLSGEPGRPGEVDRRIREAEASAAAEALIGGQSRAALDNALRRGEAAGFSVQRLISAVATPRRG
ncbi:hypothetical protein BFS79_08755 [Cutibacterium avidum]|nr:hypothetical protein BFS79_08755 [Cutibacterium avidum]